MTTTPTPGATMTTTDHRAEALRLLTPGETHDAGEWTRACPTPDQALVHAVLHLADQLRPADVRGADHAREGDGEPVPPVEPADAEPSPTDSRFDAVGWQYGVRYHDGSVTAEWNGTAQRQHAVDLARLFPDAVVVRRRLNAEWQPALADLTEVEPTPGPVVLPTTPGSVAWTRDGSVHGLTDDDDVTPWYTLAGPRRRNRLRLSGYLPAGELLALVVVRVFDAGSGQVRVLDAGTVA